MPRTRPRLGFVGPNLSHHPGWVTTQGEILARRLADSGYQVDTTSSFRQPVLRLADTLFSLWRWRRRIDVIVLSIFSGRGLRIGEVAARQASTLGLPQIHWLHGGGLPDESAERLQRLLARATAVIAPSPHLARWSTDLGIPARVIANVIDLDDYDFRQRGGEHSPLTARLLWMRTFHPLYNPLLAITALESLVARGIDATLTMAGQDRGLLDDMKRAADERGVAARVEFPGFLDREAKCRQLDQHDVFLNTNRVDNAPVSVVEAMAAGLPVVATRVGGVPDLVADGKTALLVGDDDGQAMASAVERLIDQPGLAHRLSSAGRRRAESFSWPRVEPQWAELFERVTADVGEVCR